jgi:hypothetical protein
MFSFRPLCLSVTLAACAAFTPTFSPAANAAEKAKAAYNSKDGNYGPFVSHCNEASFPMKENYAYKAVVVKLATDMSANGTSNANLCFDTELMRVSCAWDGGYLKLPSGRDGIEGHPLVSGNPAFGTKIGPGWSKGGSFTDPRPQGQGPLPADWAKWKGIHLDGTRVILDYTVGGARVLEAPAYTAASTTDGAVFQRAITIAATSEPLSLLICEEDGATAAVAGASATLGSDAATTAVVLIGTADGVKLEAAGTRLLLTLAPSTKSRSLVLALARGAKDAAVSAAKFCKATAKDLTTLPALTTGSEPRWGKPLATTFTKDAGTGPYVVDTIAVPFDNPWKSYVRLTGFDFFPDGRAAVSTMDGDVWIVSNIKDGETPQWQRYATGLFQSLGVKIVGKTIFVLGRDQITELHDLNNDGEADFYENFNNDCVVTNNYHEFALDLQTDKAGNFYYAKGTPWPPEATSPHQGTMIKISKDGAKFETIATGLRAPNGLGMGPNDELTFSDNQGHWMPACKINLVKPGGFYGMVQTAHLSSVPTTFEQPLCWLPMNMDNSSGGEGWVSGNKWGPFAGHMVHTSYGKGTFFLVMHEEVKGQIQGGAVKLPLNFSSGIMRIRENPVDGQIYVLGMRGWQTSGAQPGAFQRVRWTGKPTYMPTALHVQSGGIAITFTDALSKAEATDLSNYGIVQWNYKWTGNYGSPEFKLSDGKPGHDVVTPTAATLSTDGKTVTLAIPDLKPVNQMKITVKISAADGEVVSHEIYNTINAVP